MDAGAAASELRLAVRQLSERGLRCSAKWAAEQLVGLRRAPRADESHAMAVEACGGGEAELEADTVLLAKVYFDVNEFLRAAHTLRHARGPHGRFLRWYSLFLAGEKRKDEESLEESAGPRQGARNEQLPTLHAELSAAAAAGTLDGYGHYVYALTLRELQRPEAAVAALKASVERTPCLWAAWCEMAALSAEGEVDVGFTDHWMAGFFRAHAAIEAQENTKAIEMYEALREDFPNSPYVKCQLALAKYNLREFDESQSQFESLLEEDPYRLDQVDTYSNILYVKESKRALSALAHKCVSVDKYRPESCCVIGNYYSLKAEHEKAVLYFRRALKLNRSFLSAWTLMGHEYVELKNTAAAVDAYRHAVDINAKDYRAWYGLGQTYEILQMPFYALFYYRKATALRPYDARMWCAMAGCYKLLSRKQDAIKCYQRAESNHDREGIAYTELARLFRDEGDKAQAAHYFRETLSLHEVQEVSGPETQEALLFLAQYCMDTGNLQEAQQHCNRLLDFGGHEKEEAKALLRDIRSQYCQQPHGN